MPEMVRPHPPFRLLRRKNQTRIRGFARGSTNHFGYISMTYNPQSVFLSIAAFLVSSFVQLTFAQDAPGPVVSAPAPAGYSRMQQTLKRATTKMKNMPDWSAIGSTGDAEVFVFNEISTTNDRRKTWMLENYYQPLTWLYTGLPEYFVCASEASLYFIDCSAVQIAFSESICYSKPNGKGDLREVVSNSADELRYENILPNSVGYYLHQKACKYKINK
jgi:hypothetical protein